MGYLLRSRSIAANTPPSTRISDDKSLKKDEVLPNGGSSKKNRIARTPTKNAKRRIDGALKPVDANIRRRQLPTKKARSNRVSKAPQKSPVLFPSLRVWNVEGAGQTDFHGQHKEQEETGGQETAAKAVAEAEELSTFLGAARCERQPIQRSVISAANNRRVGPTHLKEPSKHATKAAEKARFHAAYVIADPSWTICCSLPQGSIRTQFAGEFSSNCIYHLSIFGQRASCWLEGVADVKAAQDARDRTGMCSCQNSADGLPEQTIVVTRTGFDLAKRWREQLSLEDGQESTYGWLRLFDDVLRDFMEESRVEQYRKRPLPLWSKIEAMAWIFQAMPPNWGSRGDWPTKQRQHRCIMMIGSAILTTMEAMIMYKLFKANSTIRNLGLVLALLIRSTGSTSQIGGSGPSHTGPFNDGLCLYNENGWASVVVELAQTHGVSIHGIEDIDLIIAGRQEKAKSLKAKRDEARIARYTIHHLDHGEVNAINPSEETLALAAMKEGQASGMRTTWKPQDDFDSDGVRFWKRWNFLRDYELYYCSTYSWTTGPCDQYRG